MNFYLLLKSIIRVIWTTTPLRAPIEILGTCLRIAVIIIFTFAGLVLSVNFFNDISYPRYIRKRYEPTTCVLHNYVNYTVVVPYTESFVQGGCSHFFEVSYEYTTIDGTSTMPFNATIPEVTPGLCEEDSRSLTNWPTGELESKRKCYFNPWNPSLVVLEKPRVLLAPAIIFLIVYIIFILAIYPISLIFLIIYLVRLCKPHACEGRTQRRRIQVVRERRREVVRQDGQNIQNNRREGRNNNERGGGGGGGGGGGARGGGSGGGGEGEERDEGNENTQLIRERSRSGRRQEREGSDEEENLTPAQLQMRQLGWF